MTKLKVEWPLPTDEMAVAARARMVEATRAYHVDIDKSALAVVLDDTWAAGYEMGYYAGFDHERKPRQEVAWCSVHDAELLPIQDRPHDGECWLRWYVGQPDYPETCVVENPPRHWKEG